MIKILRTQLYSLSNDKVHVHAVVLLPLPVGASDILLETCYGKRSSKRIGIEWQSMQYAVFTYPFVSRNDYCTRLKFLD